VISWASAQKYIRKVKLNFNVEWGPLVYIATSVRLAKSLRSKSSAFTLIRRQDYSVMVEYGLIYLKLYAKEQSSPFRGPEVFAF
jgi:hypothetical protein